MPSSAQNAFQYLSVKDLLEAREAFHIHLMKKENVIGTAIGRYRERKPKTTGAKTIDNTVVTADSWPCILVFVKLWWEQKDFAAQKNFDDYVPSTVYLPDGREVPLCVIQAPQVNASQDLVPEQELIFPSDYVGGGYPMIIQSQGVERTASIGCIVSDGNQYYALTNRHVAGNPGTIVYTKVKGTLVPIGKSTSKHIGNVPFEKLYKGWSASNMVTNVDVGLIEIDDIRYWKTGVFNIGDLGKVFDLNTNNLTMNVIGTGVKAYGCVSGLMEGEIAALFYRYKSVGGLEYVADFLIGAKDGQNNFDTRHGDSGTLWVLDTADKTNQPVAIQWGQHCFMDGGKIMKQNFVLGTCLSNVLRELEVDIVSGWNTETDYTWGEVGHYTIANFAAGMVTNKELKDLLKNNLELITFQQADLITDTAVKAKRKTTPYTPLADVPDLVWKIRGGPYQRFLENPNHFADMDKLDSQNQTLLDLCQGQGKNMKYLTPEEWLTYYSDKDVKDSSKGILPFRAWQIFLKMVEYAGKGDIAGYIASAGILAHYVGDACQPLHISYMFNGKPAEGAGEKTGDGVHEAFEAKMINKYNKDIIAATNGLVGQKPYKDLLALGSGKEAGAAVVTLMQETFGKIEPETIVDAFIADEKGFVATFWESTGKTVVPELFASGASTLASLWNSAWVLGKGSVNIKNLSKIDPGQIVTLYQNKDFLPSVNIHEIKQYLD